MVCKSKANESLLMRQTGQRFWPPSVATWASYQNSQGRRRELPLRNYSPVTSIDTMCLDSITHTKCMCCMLRTKVMVCLKAEQVPHPSSSILHIILIRQCLLGTSGTQSLYISPWKCLPPLKEHCPWKWNSTHEIQDLLLSSKHYLAHLEMRDHLPPYTSSMQMISSPAFKRWVIVMVAARPDAKAKPTMNSKFK